MSVKPNTTLIDLSSPPFIINIEHVVEVPERNSTFVLPDLWTLHLFDYHATLTVDGVAYPIRPGSISLIRPGAEYGTRITGRSPHLYAHFRLLPAAAAAPPTSVRVVQDLAGEELRFTRRILESACESFHLWNRRSCAALWELLWWLVERTRRQLAPLNQVDPLEKACHLIDASAGRRLTVPELAREAGLSPSQLLRRFRARFGLTTEQYIHKTRVRQACNLLFHTERPVKEIAQLTGLGNLQNFSQAIRRELGCSPRAYRAKFQTMAIHRRVW